MADANLTLPPALATDARFKLIAQIALEAFQIDLSPLLVNLVDSVDTSVLPYLAEQWSLLGDGFELAQNEAAQREMLRTATLIHQRKGTPWAIRQMFMLFGFGNIDIEEGRAGYRRDGTISRNSGWAVRGDASVRWAEYRIKVHKMLTVQQEDLLKRLLNSVIAPARCCLVSIDYIPAMLVRDGKARRDGAYNRNGTLQDSLTRNGFATRDGQYARGV